VGSQWLPGGHGGRIEDAGSGDDREDPSGAFRAAEADQGDLPGVSGVAEGRTQGKAHKHPELTDRTVWQVFEAERIQLVPIRGPFDGFHATQASVSKTCLVMELLGGDDAVREDRLADLQDGGAAPRCPPACP
jgi:hypothetical protein